MFLPKALHWLLLSIPYFNAMYILGISAFYHDSAACLIKDSEIIAAVQEERFSRVKNDASFPFQSISFCLNFEGISLYEVDYVVFYEKPFLKFERLIETYLAFAPAGIVSFLKSIPLWIKEKLFQKKTIIKNLKQTDERYTGNNLLFTEHHQAHAASAFFPSPFKEALILTVDGVGEWTTTSVAKGFENGIEVVKEIKFPHSIGLLYSTFTYYLGFKVNSDEYKVMGLAPYGKPKYLDLIYTHLIDIKEDGSFRLNLEYFGYCTGLRMTNKKFHKLFNAEPRQPGEDITTFHMDLASSIQKVTEEIMVKIAGNLYKEFKIKNLCLAGGVALNCVANGKILRETPFEKVWIQPAAGDAGCALGAAYWVYYKYLKNKRKESENEKDGMKGSLLGPSYTKSEVRKLSLEKDITFYELEADSLYETLAKEIAMGKVIGWFKGRMEYGPRALGARSIIGDPRNPKMQSLINQKIKFRESFRPFAPAILEEFVSDYFDLQIKSPYMLLVADILPKHQQPLSKEESKLIGFEKLKHVYSNFPAITHVDYSSRIQTVNKEENADFYNLIDAFYRLTGCPIIINTSFNIMDEPIVCSPEDALRCFQKSGLDVLVIENLIVNKD